METIRKEPIKNEINEMESIKVKIVELDEYKIELEVLYDELKLELGEKDS